MVQGLVAVYKGNMSKILVAGVIWFSLGLLMCTYTAPLFTDVARGAGFAIPAAAAMITSFNILGKPMLGFVFLLHSYQETHYLLESQLQYTQ